MTADQTGPVLAAQQWIGRHVDPRARVLVDDTFYVDLVDAGFAPRVGAVWFYKLDFSTNLDPSIVRQLPQGWRAFDYVVSSEIIRSALAQNPSSLAQVRQALQHSAPIATFGAGRTRVEIRRIKAPGSGSGLLPKAPPPAPERAAAPPPAVAAPPRPAPNEHRAHRRPTQRARHRSHRRGGRK
jgi:hypothetical protein